MQYLLDSDVIIDFLQGKDPGYSLVGKILDRHLDISVMTWIEILYGIKKGYQSGKKLNQFIGFLEDSSIKIIPVSPEIGSYFVDLKLKLEKKGEILADFDLLIASTSKVYKLTLVTRNKKHFDHIPNLKVIT